MTSKTMFGGTLWDSPTWFKSLFSEQRTLRFPQFLWPKGSSPLHVRLVTSSWLPSHAIHLRCFLKLNTWGVRWEGVRMERKTFLRMSWPRRTCRGTRLVTTKGGGGLERRCPPALGDRAGGAGRGGQAGAPPQDAPRASGAARPRPRSWRPRA